MCCRPDVTMCDMIVSQTVPIPHTPGTRPYEYRLCLCDRYGLGQCGEVARYGLPAEATYHGRL
eukprot:scaffold219186_cov17-Prasinocladus_malaysianus.AAC.1